jgi:nicotinamide-nucleotide amidase
LEDTAILAHTTIADLLRNILRKLQSQGATVATAESCTGGMVATMLTDLPGSSTVFVGGISAYANGVKISMLGVGASDLEKFGAVSAEVARAMAAGARDRLGATYAVALTGIAGPDGGSPDKPVGTVYCGIASPLGEVATRLTLSGDRSTIRRTAAESALQLLADAIKD